MKFTAEFPLLCLLVYKADAFCPSLPSSRLRLLHTRQIVVKAEPDALPPLDMDTERSESSGLETQEAAAQRLESLTKEMNQGAMLFQAEQYEEAVAQFSICSAFAEKTLGRWSEATLHMANIYNNRSACYEKLGRLDEALADAICALNFSPGHQRADERRLRIIESISASKDR